MYKTVSKQENKCLLHYDTNSDNGAGPGDEVINSQHISFIFVFTEKIHSIQIFS